MRMTDGFKLRGFRKLNSKQSNAERLCDVTDAICNWDES